MWLWTGGRETWYLNVVAVRSGPGTARRLGSGRGGRTRYFEDSKFSSAWQARHLNRVMHGSEVILTSYVPKCATVWGMALEILKLTVILPARNRGLCDLQPQEACIMVQITIPVSREPGIRVRGLLLIAVSSIPVQTRHFSGKVARNGQIPTARSIRERTKIQPFSTRLTACLEHEAIAMTSLLIQLEAHGIIMHVVSNVTISWDAGIGLDYH